MVFGSCVPALEESMASIKMLLFILLLMILGAAPFSSPYALLGCSGNPCVIRYAPGGNAWTHLVGGMIARLTGLRIVVDGLCASGCITLVSVASNVCMRSGAQFGFHESNLGMAMTPFIAPSIDRIYRERHGEYKAARRYLSASDLARVFDLCDDGRRSRRY